MAISVSCSICGKKYQFQDSMAGKRLRCDGCNSPIDVPGTATAGIRNRTISREAPAPEEPAPIKDIPVAEPAPRATRPTRKYRPPSQGYGAVPQAYRSAAWNTFIVCAVLFVGGSCLGGSVLVLIKSGQNTLRADSQALAVGNSIGAFASSIALFVCGLMMRKGSRPALITALVVTSLLEIAFTYYTAKIAVGFTVAPQIVIVPFILSLVGMGAFGQLLFFHIRALRAR